MHSTGRILACALLVVCAQAQTATPAVSDAPKASASAKAKPDTSKSTAKSKKVWTNEDVDKIESDINVVGSELPNVKSSGKGSVMDRPRQRGLQFTATTLSGERFTSDSVFGHPVLVQFWATWCGYCRRDQANVEKIAAAHGDLIVLAVDVGEARAVVEYYLNSSPRSVNIVLSKDTNLHDLLRAGGVPHYVLIGRDGQVAGMRHGYAGEKGLESLIKNAGV